MQGRRKEFKSGGTYGERWARAYIGSLGAKPSVGSRGRALGLGSGEELSALKLKGCSFMDVQQSGHI